MNSPEPFDEVAHTSGAVVARMVEDPVDMAEAPIAAGDTAAEEILRHTHAADTALAPPPPVSPIRAGADTRPVANGLGRWIGDVRRRFETVRQYVRGRDARTIQSDAMGVARRYPIQALAGTLLAGLVVGRLLRKK